MLNNFLLENQRLNLSELWCYFQDLWSGDWISDSFYFRKKLSHSCHKHQACDRNSSESLEQLLNYAFRKKLSHSCHKHKGCDRNSSEPLEQLLNHAFCRILAHHKFLDKKKCITQLSQNMWFNKSFRRNSEIWPL